jgi:hypothetical protein
MAFQEGPAFCAAQKLGFGHPPVNEAAGLPEGRHTRLHAASKSRPSVPAQADKPQARGEASS